MSGRQRVDGQTAFILHSYAYSETSLIIDVFSRDFGRLPLLARGARRPRSAMRGVLQAFQPLELAWFGAGEVRTLARAEWLGGMPMLGGTALLLGYYLNELLMKLLPREDAHAALFNAYATTLQSLAQSRNGSVSATTHLRQFEKALLRELGYGMVLEREAVTGEAVLPDRLYHYLIERGPVLTAANHEVAGDQIQGQTIRGKTLLDLARDDYADPRTLSESKLLMRMLINHYLAGQALQSRRVFLELQEL
ncbi:MAG: DNA repair protein RecO [Betaproteobacteria bacterium]|nr:DNA repair protein RecO [Betaproteobacteria bacterium]